MTIPAGARLRAAVAEERPLQVVGAINAYCALLAQRAGFRALYLSGAGVANASFGLPDLGITSLNDVCEDVRRIAGATELPLASLRQVYLPDVYERLCREAGVTSDRSGWFPPYRAAGRTKPGGR